MHTAMANEDEKICKSQLDELNAWISGIPLSKSIKNLARDFSDAVMMAEILKVYYPRYVDLHNYVPASSLTTKKETWNILNRKVLSKIDMKLTKDTINQIVNCNPGAAENILLQLRSRLLKHSVPQNRQDLPCKENDFVEEVKSDELDTKIAASEDSSSRPVDRSPLSIIDHSKRSIFAHTAGKFYFLLRWLLSCFCFWSYFPSVKFRSSLNEGEACRAENTEEEDTVPRHICAQLSRQLQEIDDIICTLNHQVAYLKSAMKLKDQRISNLTSQILQNTVESEQVAKVQANDAQVKPRAQNAREKLIVEE